MRDVVDRVSELVDEQLSGYEDRSGYDYNVNQDECPHCGRDWHGLAITQRMQHIRFWGVVPDGYRYADDESPIVCEGSMFIGPRKPTRGEQREANRVQPTNEEVLEAARRLAESVNRNAASYREGMQRLSEQARRAAEAITAVWVRTLGGGQWTRAGGTEPGSVHFTAGHDSSELTFTTRRRLLSDSEPTPPEPVPPANPERWQHLPRLPRPSTQPPMWAARADGRRR